MKKMAFMVFIFGAIIVAMVDARVTVNLSLSNITIENNQGVTEFPGAEIYGDAGLPALPSANYSVLLPPDADMNSVQISLEGLSEEKLAGLHTVAPIEPPMTIHGPQWPEYRTIVNGKDVDVYSTDAMFPYEHAQVVDIGQLYCYKLVTVQVGQFRYNPVTKELSQIRSGVLVVDFNKEAGYTSSRNKAIVIPEAIAQRVMRKVVNYSDFSNNYKVDFNFTGKKKMAIITTEAIKTGTANFQAFVDSKKKRGIDVEVVTNWGSSAQNLRAWLQSNYQTLGLYYVLLIGNSGGDVPMMTFSGYAYGSSRGTYADCPADWPYCQLTGDYKADKTCELSVGRFPVYNNDLKTLESIMAKTIAYESAAPADIAWRYNALFAGPGYNSGSNMACVPCNAIWQDFVQKTQPWKAYRIYGTRWGTPTGPAPDETGNEDKVIAKWSSTAFGLVDWATHGSDVLAQDVLTSSNTGKIGNKNPSFVFCGSCSNATITKATNLTYSILRDCGIGAIGGTNLTYYGGSYQTSGSDNGWCYKFGKHLIADKLEIGDALTELRELDPSYAWRNRGPYVLYGDPSIGIGTCAGSTGIETVTPKKAETSVAALAYSLVNTISVKFTVTHGTSLIKIFNLHGKEMTTLSIPAGSSVTSWNRTDKSGAPVGSGIYVATLSIPTPAGLQAIASTRIALK
ncbi:MAG: hypothetical protein JW795_24140 [Chitinivibrionales bacterium]|nr:hypothetical protein [Chitinivibrionales bacterium]